MDSKPSISYAGDEALFSSLQFGVSQQLSIEPVEWRRSFGRAPKPVCVEAVFVKFSEDIIPKENDWKLMGQTFFHTYWTDCVDIDQYKANLKEDISNWLSVLRNHGVHDWLIITVETIDSRKGNKTKLLPRASVLDKIKSDFCSRQLDRCVAVLDPLKSDARGAESWQNLLSQIRQLVLQAYNRNLSKFEEHMRSQRERRNEGGWSFCEYFLLQEELAFVFEMLGIYDEALVQYDELDALFTQFVLNSNVGDTPQWLQEFSRTCDSWLGLALARTLNEKRRCLIGNGRASLLDLRNYLFSKQCSLLLLLFRPWEVAQRTLPYLHNCINELRILEVTLPPGAVSCWVFLSCLEVLQTCERFNDSSHVEAYSLYTAGLWAYARDKLQELGSLCGLMPGSVETSEQLHMVVGLLAGMVEDNDEETKNPTTPMSKLREALSSKDSFRHHYLELSELAMGTFKHIGRIRSARLIGKDLAHFYMKLGEPQKAAAFLCDVLKTSVQECWTLLTTHTQLELVNCYKIMKDYEKCVKMCSQIAANRCISDDIRLAHFKEMEYLSSQLSNEKLLIFAQSLFDIDAITINASSDIIICESCVTFNLKLSSHFVQAVKCKTISLAVHYQQQQDDQSSTGLKFVNGMEEKEFSGLGSTKPLNWGSDWMYLKSCTPIILEEQFDYKQDHSLTNANLVCKNLQALLRRRDSQVGFHKERDIVKEDFRNCVTARDVTLKPGENILTFKYLAGESGCYILGQLSIEMGNLEFLIPKTIPSVSFNVVCEEPKIFLQRASKGDLIAGAERELILTVQTGSKIIEPDTVVRLQASKGLLLKVDGGEEKPAFMQSVECLLPPVGPFKSVATKVKVLAEVASQKETSALERKVLIVSPWSMKKQESSLVFVLPFTASHKLQTTNSRKYVQVTVQGLQEEIFELFNHKLTILNRSDIAVVPMNPLTQRLVVCKDQNATYLWELVCNLMDSPVLHLEFATNYRHKSLTTSNSHNEQCVEEQYKCQFDISDYKVNGF